jgi:hypothetical protein
LSTSHGGQTYAPHHSSVEALSKAMATGCRCGGVVNSTARWCCNKSLASQASMNEHGWWCRIDHWPEPSPNGPFTVCPSASCHHMGPQSPFGMRMHRAVSSPSVRRLPRDSHSLCAPFGKVLALTFPLAHPLAGATRRPSSAGMFPWADCCFVERLLPSTGPQTRRGHHDSASAPA